MRVVHLSAYGGPYEGSFIPMLQAAHDAVQARGWNFEAVFSPGVDMHAWYAKLRERGVNTRVAPATDRRGVGWIRSLLDEANDPVLLHTHFSDFDLPAALAVRGHADAAVIWHLHSPIAGGFGLRARNTLRFGVFGRMTDRILCVGAQIREDAVHRLAPSARTRVFLNGIDVDHYTQIDRSDRGVARAGMKLPPESVVLVLFAWDWERKGGPLMLETVRELRRRGGNPLALLVGAPDVARSAARQLGIEQDVRWIPPVDDASRLYAVADLFISASTAEGLPFAMLEALCSGVPVVASDISAHRDVSSGLPGCRLASREPAAFATAIERELDAAADRDFRLTASRAEVARSFSLTDWSQRLLGVYDDVIG